jgi:hypothetical protein
MLPVYYSGRGWCSQLTIQERGRGYRFTIGIYGWTLFYMFTNTSLLQILDALGDLNHQLE